MNCANLRRAEPTDLFALYAAVLEELRRRQVIRSTNNPAADYAEFLVVKALDLHLAPKSTAGYDATDPNGKRYEIKGRRLTAHNKSRQLSAIRGLAEHHFAYLAGVLFAEDFSVLRACLVPVDMVEKEATYRKHINGWILHLRDALWDRPGVQDITERVKAAAEAQRAGS